MTAGAENFGASCTENIRPHLGVWRAFWVWQRARHARWLIRASMVAFDAGKRNRAAMLLGDTGKVVAEMGDPLG